MSIRENLFKNTGAAAWTRISGALVRLIQVPLLLSYMGVEDFGRWLVLFTLPSWLLVANLGFGTVASNEMSMAVSSGDLKTAKNIYSTTVTLVLAGGIIGCLLVGITASLLPWDHFLNVSAGRRNEIAGAATWLAASIFLTFLIEPFLGRFRAARKTHVGVVISSFGPWMDLLGIMIALHFSKRFDYLSFAIFISTLVFYFINLWVSWRTMPELSFSWKEVQIKRFRYLFRKGAAFQAFPLGNALLFQGNVLIVQAILGPAAVAIFATARTLVRTVNQIMELLNQAIWPELSHLFGSNDMEKAKKLHRTGVGISFTVSCLGAFFLAFFGEQIYHLWVGKTIQLPSNLLLIFLIPIPFNALWFTSSVVHLACNKHEGLAVRYLFATVLSGIACITLSYYQGIRGAAISTIIVDIILIPYVLKKSLYLTGDTWNGFMSGIAGEARFAKQYFLRFLGIIPK